MQEQQYRQKKKAIKIYIHSFIQHHHHHRRRRNVIAINDWMIQACVKRAASLTSAHTFIIIIIQ